ncbi:MAG: hypothetical protein JNJ89_17710 [Rubrivivax sp.]|nr:hypothetical protein [Rubrivivax sp.]
MAPRLHYIGDEIGAAGWRLAGATVQVPAAGHEAQALQAACSQHPGGAAQAGGALVLLSAAVAARIDAAVLQPALAALSPLLLVVPDTQGDEPAPDIAARLRRQLGLDT